MAAHLAACGRCRAAFDRVLSTHRRVRAWLAELQSPADHGAFNVSNAFARVLYRAKAFGHEIPWYSRSVRPGALASSFAAQGLLVALLMLMGTNDAVRREIERMTLVAPTPVVRQTKPASNHGGGGGQRSPLLPPTGELPIPAPRVFTAPVATVERPALVMDPSLIAPPDAWAAPTSAIGSPLAALTTGGGGRRGDGGLGDGGSFGIGNGNDGGLEGNGSAGISSAGNGVTAPSVLTRVDPEYSEEARKAKYSGSVILSIVVSAEGKAENIRVVRSLGMGLDEKAIEAVRQWRFKPGTNKGIPVKVRAQVDVNFRLL